MTKFLPKTIDVLGIRYKIIFPYIFTTKECIIGLHDAMKREIRLSAISTSSDKLPISQIHCTLLHEIIHALINVLYSNPPPEEIIEGLSFGLYQVLVDNPELYTKKIPPTVKVGGFIYKITHPHIFADDDNVSISASNMQERILIAEAGSLDFKFEKLTYAICNAVYYIYCGGRDGEDLHPHFDQALYNTIKTNGLAKLFRKYRGK
uniref:SprT-like domain-containing protein n=1 Tax=viral metagenome TaxID=1070528 RepID=A0A6M3KZR1_9ZZZZ